MNSWVYITGALCLALLFFLLWKEATRSNRGRRGWRLLATICSVVSLYLLAVPLVYHAIKTTTSNAAILLTDGTDADSLSKFLHNTGKHMPVLTFDKNIAGIRGYQAKLIVDPADLAENNYSVVHVFGYGIGKNELPGQPVIFHPTPLPTGFTAVNWQRASTVGERLAVQGNFHNTTTSPVKISLAAYSSTLDSVTVPAMSDQHFQLTTLPKQLGRGVYTLSAVTKKDTLAKEPVPVQVIKSSPLKILLLIASPDFENKFLKNWLAEKGYEVVVRTTVSKNKTSKEFLNTAAVNINNIKPELLERFDITIADAAELSSLSSGEIQSIRTAVSQKGKGLIIRADSAAARNAFYAPWFPVAVIDTGTQHSVNLHLITGNAVLQPLNTPAAFFIRVQNGTQPLVADRENRVMVNSALLGSGKILLSTLPNTFSWVLSGNQNDYNTVWSELITRSSPQKIVDEAWHFSPALPRVNEQVNVSLESNNSAVRRGQLAGSTIHLINDSRMPYRWNGMFWPVKQGWQAGIQLNGAIYYWYAYAQDDWKGISVADKTRITQQLSNTAAAQDNTVNQTITTQTEAVPKIIFLLVFLACCGYLWFENKYYNS